MKVTEIMARNPVCCTPEADLQSVAKLMRDNDCGEIPVIEDENSHRLVGVITDRDIVCRSVADGYRPDEVKVEECMSAPATSITMDADVEQAVETMQKQQIRRIPVVDREKRCVGIVAQADVARSSPREKTGEVVKNISRA